VRVLLVQAKSIIADWSPSLPLGLCYIGTALADSGHKVNIYDTNINSAPIPELKRLIRSDEPDIIGVSLRNVDTSIYTHPADYVQPFDELLAAIKEAAPGARIIAGGAGFSIFARRLMERRHEIDFGVFNEGEETLPELLNNLDRPKSVKGLFLRSNGAVLFTGNRKPVDFASLPAPRRDFLDLAPYLKYTSSIGVQTKRGCPFKCVYCTYPYLQGANIRMRPPKAILDEVEGLVREYGIKSFFFVDSIFNVPPKHAREIMEGMLERGFNLNWECFDELKYFNEDYFKLAKASGHRQFDFSPDGVSRSTLTSLNKSTSPEDIERGFSILKKNKGAIASFSFFINGPGESLGSLFRLCLFLIRTKLFLRRKHYATPVLLIRIYPNTPIYSLALDKGLIKPDDDLIEAVYYNPAPLKYILKVIIPFITNAYSFFRVLKRGIRRIMRALKRV
jgi:anaerobic magnesium-protoporphyrin IX monomethyl ester cyclase